MSTWIGEYFASWNRKDPDTVVSWMTDDVEYEDVTAGHVARGKDAARTFVALCNEIVPDARYELVRGHSFGDTYWAEWVMHARGTAVRGASVGTLRDGKIASNRDYWNGAIFTL